ncbi:hypothetical protein GY45DRAFT_125624 [Cubamyces sp. BRFM 1775]|nr:hypothetical protein GY45DRAFT_125624 [Cubamyces sp. BRFM 1775]
MLAPCATARVDGERRGEEVASSGRPREQVRTVTRKREEGLLTATYLSESPVIHVLPSPVTFSKVLCPRPLCHSERRFTQHGRGRSQRGTSFHTRPRSSRFIGAGPGKAVSARVTGSLPRLPHLQRTLVNIRLTPPRDEMIDFRGNDEIPDTPIPCDFDNPGNMAFFDRQTNEKHPRLVSVA